MSRGHILSFEGRGVTKIDSTRVRVSEYEKSLLLYFAVIKTSGGEFTLLRGHL